MAEPTVYDMTPPRPDEVVLPLPREMHARDWVRRAIIWVLVLAGFFVLTRLDTLLLNYRNQIFPRDPQGWAKQVILGFRDFGQVLPIVTAVLIIYRIDRRRWLIIFAIVVAQALASLGYNTGKMVVARYRPYAAYTHFEGDQAERSWLGWKYSLRRIDKNPDLWDDATKSFPSGHSAAAFAFAGVLVWFYPRIRGILWVLAGGCALSRVLDAVHWPSDCWMGATIGYTAAWIALRPYLWALPVIYRRRRFKQRQARLRGARRERDGSSPPGTPRSPSTPA